MAAAHDPVSRRYVQWSVISLVILTLVTLLIGFVWLPSAHPEFRAQGIWAAICRAAGVPTRWNETTEPVKARVSTRVILPDVVKSGTSQASIGLGATLALQQCTMCHGAQGVTAADTPNLAGQYREVIMKQLVDYKNGDRAHSVMQALAANLADDDIQNLAAYYASLPKPRLEPTADDLPAPALVRVGDPVRNIAPCASCHGGIDRKLGTPWLEHMPKRYLEDQLHAFATGARRNDIHAQMRNVVRQMTKEEIAEVSEFYARRGMPTGHR
jgi:cytochrome c553